MNSSANRNRGYQAPVSASDEKDIRDNFNAAVQ